MKYILVTGGVISGLGKGVISSSLGTILQGLGLQVTSIKIDPYINIDAGTFSPNEHGEVYVLDDGSEVDLDCGNYERFLNIRLHSGNNITTGKIMSKVMSGERDGKYLGKTVQHVPHVTGAIREWVETISSTEIKNDDGQEIKPDICVIELGGTIGDNETVDFIEAFREMRQNLNKDDFLVVFVSLVIEWSGEQKTKPTQKSIQKLSKKLTPDIIMCRSITELTAGVRRKLVESCNVREEQIISVPNLPLYKVPQHLVDQSVIDVITKKLNLNLQSITENVVEKWNNLFDRTLSCSRDVTIALVGKYVKFIDAYASVNKATGHATVSLGANLRLVQIESSDLEEKMKISNKRVYDKAWDELRKANGMIVPGGFDKRGTDGKIAAIEYARMNNLPFLGICLGFQCAVIEFARNILNLKGANSTELDNECSHPVVIDMPEHNQGPMGGTMRLGLKKTFLNRESKTFALYGGKDVIEERHRHRYEVNPQYVDKLEKAGLHFVGKDESGIRMEVFEMKNHPYFVGVQFHPEFLSRPFKPSPPFVGLIDASINFRPS